MFALGYAADNIAVYYGYGTNSSTHSLTYSTGSGSESCMIAVGHFDNDNRPDIAVVNFDANNIIVLFGYENGSSANQTAFSTESSRVVWIQATDLKNDSITDLVTANYATRSVSVSVILGYGNGTFSNPSTYSTRFDSFPFMVVSGDFNGDKRMDLAIANFGTNNAGIMFENGKGIFGTQKQLSTGSNSYSYSIALSDLNNDFILDLVVANYENKSIGVASPYSIGIGDFNKDNSMDVIATNNGSSNVGILLGYGNGSFASSIMYLTESSSSISIAICDLNKDNRLNIVLINNDTNRIDILLGYDEGFPMQTEYAIGSDPNCGVVRDFNNDTVVDIATTNQYGNTITVGGFNNDRQLYTVVTNSGNSTVSVLLGYSNDSFVKHATYSAGTPAKHLAVGDFNKDNRNDIVVTNPGKNTISVLLEFGNGYLENRVAYSTGAFPMCVAVGDFNNDTCLDIVVANYDGNTVSVLLEYGNGPFQSQTTFPTGAYPYHLAVGDFNSDTRSDVVIVNNEESTVSVLLRYDKGVMKNEITFAPSVGARLRSVAVFYFNKYEILSLLMMVLTA
ncbi:unnamed protein product [Rotaria socialis]|uniref:Uncharacterized protein n=1 Tax=Rotaria socialis TaxID=392032 RepID=A0A819ZJW5_9BILA|nr:unnamed protein product [Rotaria socialis]